MSALRLSKSDSPRRTLRDRAKSLATTTANVLHFPRRPMPEAVARLSPDAELITLGREFELAVSQAREAREAYEAARDAYNEELGPLPPALIVSDEDLAALAKLPRRTGPAAGRAPLDPSDESKGHADVWTSTSLTHAITAARRVLPEFDVSRWEALVPEVEAYERRAYQLACKHQHDDSYAEWNDAHSVADWLATRIGEFEPETPQGAAILAKVALFDAEAYKVAIGARVHAALEAAAKLR